MEEIYYNLTGVDIEEQKKIWDERGKGYYGEYLVLKTLYQNIPGTCKILMNLQIPASHDKTTEIDLLMIHETGFYVFEIKHHKGTIYGKAHENQWTQYFRTAPNQSFRSPVKQNQYHITALKTMFPNVTIRSIVVFTNDNCDLRVENRDPNVTICRLNEMIGMIRRLYMSKRIVYEMDQIDTIFNLLRDYAPEGKNAVKVDGNVVPFYQYLETLAREFNDGVKQNKMETQKSVRKTITVYALCALCAVLICAGVSRQYAERVVEAEKALSDFAQKFEHVEEYNNGALYFSDDLITVSDVVLVESKDVLNAVNFSCRLTACGEKYGIVVGENAMINVILKDGSVKEYDLWNESYPYWSDVRLGSLLQPTGKIGMHEFYDVNVSDISYIKLTNLGIWSKNSTSLDSIADGYEVELFDCMKEPK